MQRAGHTALERSEHRPGPRSRPRAGSIKPLEGDARFPLLRPSGPGIPPCPPPRTSPASSRKPAPSRRRRSSPPQAHVKSLAEYETLYAAGGATTPRASGPSRPKSLHWFKPWDKVLDWNEPHAKWFVGGKINASVQLPRPPSGRPAQEQGRHHLGGRAGRQPRADATRSCTARSASSPTCSRGSASRRATASRSTCRWSRSWPSPCSPAPASARRTRVIFGGFRAEAVADRNNDAKAKLVITADGGWRRGKVVPLKAERRCGPGQVADRREVHRLQPLQPAGRHEAGPRPVVARADGRRLAPTAPPSRSTASTRCSSSTPPARPASPRACCTPPPATCSASSLHAPAGSSTCKEDDIYWCTADIGWVTGHSYIVYGPLCQRRDDA